MSRTRAQPRALVATSAGAARHGDGAQIPLRDGGWIRYAEHFLSIGEADRLFDALRRVTAWRQFRNRLWIFPRLTAFVADA